MGGLWEGVFVEGSGGVEAFSTMYFVVDSPLTPGHPGVRRRGRLLCQCWSSHTGQMEKKRKKNHSQLFGVFASVVEKFPCLKNLKYGELRSIVKLRVACA